MLRSMRNKWAMVGVDAASSAPLSKASMREGSMPANMGASVRAEKSEKATAQATALMPICKVARYRNPQTVTIGVVNFCNTTVVGPLHPA